MTDDRFEEFVRRAAQDYHRPPVAPRDEMWERIAVERRQRRAWQWRQPQRWVRWGLAAAAVLAVGIAIGRFTAVPVPDPGSLASSQGDEGGVSAYQVAALQHLRQVETFLTVFRTEAAAQPVESAPAAARNLLVGTRLLMDSPAAEDQRLASLLQDVELVLAQIAHFTGDDRAEELDLIQQSIERRGVLLKLRTVVPGGLGIATAQGVI